MYGDIAESDGDENCAKKEVLRCPFSNKQVAAETNATPPQNLLAVVFLWPDNSNTRTDVPSVPSIPGTAKIR